jgi:hypothetical protein
LSSANLQFSLKGFSGAHEKPPEKPPSHEPDEAPENTLSI